MKLTVFILGLLTFLPAWGDKDSCSRIVDLGDTKVVPFDETVSPDGAYAIGWTAFAKRKDAAPIDWSKWNSGNIEDFFISDGSIETDGDFYGITDCLIDFHAKKYLALPSDDPEFPRKNRGLLFAAWSPVGNGPRDALVFNDSRFYTENLWLIRIDREGLHQRDIAQAVNAALEPTLRAKRPVGTEEYSTFFHDFDEGAVTHAVSFAGETATLSFSSDVPKSMSETSRVEGKIAIRLSDGGVVKVVSDTATDDPFASNGELAQADRDLNGVYATLVKSLDPAGRAALKKEQLNWINSRDQAAIDAVVHPLDDHPDDPQAGRDEILVTQTNERLLELKKRLQP